MIDKWGAVYAERCTYGSEGGFAETASREAGMARWSLPCGNDNPGAKSQGIKQLMAGGGVALIGFTLIPLLSNLFSQ